MRWLSVMGGLIGAVIQIPFWPEPMNVLVAGFGLGVVYCAVMDWVCER